MEDRNGGITDNGEWEEKESISILCVFNAIRCMYVIVIYSYLCVFTVTMYVSTYSQADISIIYKELHRLFTLKFEISAPQFFFE